ncbi:conserved hypothethical protein (fragment) (plasmid) [Ralstonia solanacearum PSI07]
MAFPPEVIAAAGGPALSIAEVERLAGTEPEMRQEASPAEST